ncbi:MAG: nitrogen regulation protein NR(II) [Gammaproteobacteria bacterium]
MTLLNATALRRVFDHLYTAVLIFDHARVVRAANSAAEVLLSSSARQMTGQSAAQLFGDSTLVKAIERALERGETVSEWCVELGMPGHLPVEVDSTIVPIAEGPRPLQVIVELHASQHTRRAVRDDLFAARHNLVRQMVGEMAHEIKNPLGGIRGAAQLLEADLPNVALREYTRLIVGEVDRLRKLIDRMVQPSSAPRLVNVNVHEVTEYVRNLIEVEAPRSVALERDYDPSLPPLWADRDQLVQALFNVESNAVQAAGPKGRVIVRTRSLRQFTIRQRRHRLAVRIDVVDNGPGVAPEIGDSIFYPMITTRASGTGLGLTIAQNLIHAHGGLIEFESQPGMTVFSICLPARSSA